MSAIPAQSVPAAYPKHWEADVVLRDGSTMRIRPILPSDAAALQRFHMRQSAESVYLRFFAQLAELPERDLTRFTTVDHHDRVALVLVVHDEIIAVGRYDRIDEEDAEVAFNVSDQAQGRGVASVLLEHLAAAGRERGIRRFVAEVLPANTRMVRIFHEAGYDVRQKFEDGVVAVNFTIRPTDRSLEVLAERERRAEALSMQRILAAESLLIYGAGDEGARLAARVNEHVAAAMLHVDGFTGTLQHASSRAELAQLAPPVDLAVVAAPATQIIDLVEELAQLQVGGVLILTGGFSAASDTHEGNTDGVPQQRLLRTLRAAGIRLVGPRSIGVLAHGQAGPVPALLNPGQGEFSIDRVATAASGIGMFCQSANATRALLGGAQRRRLPLSSILSAGHRADVSGNDTMQFWTAQDQLSVACVHLESIGNPRKFSRVARRLAQDRPVIVRIAGQTGQVRPPGHPVRQTRAPRRALQELMDQAGVLLAESVEQQLDWAMLFHTQPLPAGNRIAIVTNSGTHTAIVGEHCTSAQLAVTSDVPTLNPVAGPKQYRQVLEQLGRRDDWDVALIGYGPFLEDSGADIAEQIAHFAHATEKPVLAQVHGITGLDPRLSYASTQVPGFSTGEDAVAAARVALSYAQRRQAPAAARINPTGIDRRRALRLVEEELAGIKPGDSLRLGNDRAAELLGAYGVPVLTTRRVQTETAMVAAAHEIGWPVALKSADEVLRHRSDLGGVRLDLNSPEELRQAYRTMLERIHALGRDAGDAGFEVQAMAPTGAACVVTATEDPLYGPLVSFGLGGDAVELLGDISYRVPPLTEADVTKLITSVNASPRLHGYRGLPALDVEGLADVIGRVSVLKEELSEVERVEINPVLVAETSVVILSATVDIAHSGRGDMARRVLPE